MESMNPEKKYLELAEKWLNNTITRREEVEFSEWYNSNGDKTIFLPPSFAENEAILKARILQNILSRKGNVDGEIPIGKNSFIRVAAAAAILIFLAAGSWLYFNHRSGPHAAKNDEPSKRFKDDVSPGSNKAVLTLADGSQIILDNAQNGILTQQGDTKISKPESGQLSYQATGTKVQGEVLYNTISTPKGGQYQVVLPDGSKVWLNAASSLRFPIAFVGKQRNVELTGEAYFEVMPRAPKGGQKMPFLVQVNSSLANGGMNVQVLGTHFNIMAYSDENAIKTTLLEGLVKVTKGTVAALLNPGKEADLGKNADKFRISNADVEEAVAWKNGLFQFNNTDIKMIMRQIVRWYDVDVSFEGNMANKNFSGPISKNTNISQVLKFLELTNEVHFRIEGRRIVVME